MHVPQLLGLERVPAIIREMTDDEATVKMVDSNIQREELLPSEKAFAYKMKMDAMRRQGARTGIRFSRSCLCMPNYPDDGCWGNPGGSIDSCRCRGVLAKALAIIMTAAAGW